MYINVCEIVPLGVIMLPHDSNKTPSTNHEKLPFKLSVRGRQEIPETWVIVIAFKNLKLDLIPEDSTHFIHGIWMN